MSFDHHVNDKVPHFKTKFLLGEKKYSYIYIYIFFFDNSIKIFTSEKSHNNKI